MRVYPMACQSHLYFTTVLLLILYLKLALAIDDNQRQISASNTGLSQC